MSNILEFDIVIVGGGIAGSALACALDNSSLKVLVLEGAAPAPLIEPCFDSAQDFDARVSALTLASQNFLQDLGVWSAIDKQRLAAFRNMFVFDGEGTGTISFAADEVGTKQLGHIVENRVIVSSLQQKLQFSTNVKLMHQAKVESLSRSEQGYRLQLAASDERSKQITCKLLVGADGANSFVRHQCEFKTREWNYGHHAIVCTVETSQAHQNTAWQSFTEFGPLALLPLSSNKAEQHFASIVWSVEPEEADRLLALDDKAFSQALSQGIEYKCGEVIEMSKRFSFPLRQRHARNYSKPHVVLVGDAAHTIHPLAGQGINLGLKDVAVLSEELLKAVANGNEISDKLLLKRYERRRKPDNLAMMAIMEGFRRLYGEQSSMLLRLLRNRGMDSIDTLKPLKNKIIQQAMGL